LDCGGGQDSTERDQNSWDFVVQR